MADQFPRGKLNRSDEGSARVAVAAINGTVVIRFEKPIAWLGLGYDEAKSLGESLLRKAEEIRQ